jgi:hypothetical protein
VSGRKIALQSCQRNQGLYPFSIHSQGGRCRSDGDGKFYRELIEAMGEYASKQFALAVRQKDGYSLRDHLESGYRQTGVMPEELNIEPLPSSAVYLWNWFLEMHRGRSSNGFGANAISFLEIFAWQRVKGQTLTDWEVEGILAMDAAFLSSAAAQPKVETQ